MRRIGVLMAIPSDDPEGKSRLAAFVQGLQKFGWTEGSNVHTEARLSGDDADLCRRYAEELVALAPDVLVASTSLSVAALQRVTRSVPIIFANIIDPVGAGFIRSMARPGATQPDLFRSSTALAGNGLNSLRSSHRKRRA
jgi:putative tryptophan/tyrosine transport system substrate-binding protein